MASTSKATNPPVVRPGLGNTIIINKCQRLNPVLDAIRNVPKEFGDIVPDFRVGRTTCVLYLSLKYHRLHPEYIHGRIEKIAGQFTLRILLILCDISEHQDSIKELTKTCLINNITIFVAWSIDEAAHYLTTFKQFEYKPPDLIKERVEKDYPSMLRAGLTSIKGINKTDVETLRTNFGSLLNISKASEQTLLNLPGFGPTKVRRLQEVFQKPFYPNKRKKAPDHVPTTMTTEEDELTLVEGEMAMAQATMASSSRTRVEDLEMDDSGVHLARTGLAAGSGPSMEVQAQEATSIIELRSSESTAVERPRRLRSPSPIWDIELDLNDFNESPPGAVEGSTAPASDVDRRPSKKQKNTHVAGDLDSDSISSFEDD